MCLYRRVQKLNRGDMSYVLFTVHNMQLIMFTKMLKNIGNLTLEQAGDHMVEMGFDGADLTVREGGYVLPGEVDKVLPDAVDTLKSRGLGVPMITTSITDANKPYAIDTFKAASDCGIEYIKLGYWDYGGFGKAREQIREMRSDLNGIYKLCEDYDVNAAVHIHSGNCLSSSAVLLWMLLQGYDPTHLGAYIDPGHMAVEGGLTGWRMGMDLLRENTRIVAVKDFGWFKGVNKGWGVEIVPLSEGLVPWTEVFQYLRKMEFDGPVSLHSEYEHYKLSELIHQTKNDLEYIRDILNKL